MTKWETNGEDTTVLNEQQKRMTSLLDQGDKGEQQMEWNGHPVLP